VSRDRASKGRIAETSELRAPLRGIIPPPVTPLVGRDELDVEGLERLIEHVLAGGVHGLLYWGQPTRRRA
jgi:4-hydroxy-tetrahydrodipicolinate synthase